MEKQLNKKNDIDELDDIGEIDVVIGMPKGKYDIDRVVEDEELIIDFVNVNLERFSVSFGDRVIAHYKQVEEADFKRVDVIMTHLKTKELGLDTIYFVTNSPLLQKIEKQSYEFYRAWDLKHYLIVSSNYLMDIITYDECYKISE